MTCPGARLVAIAYGQSSRRTRVGSRWHGYRGGESTKHIGVDLGVVGSPEGPDYTAGAQELHLRLLKCRRNYRGLSWLSSIVDNLDRCATPVAPFCEPDGSRVARRSAPRFLCHLPNPLCVKWLIRRVLWRARSTAVAGGRIVVCGSGSDFAEETGRRDARPVAQASRRSRLSSRALLSAC